MEAEIDMSERINLYPGSSCLRVLCTVET